MKVQVTHVAYEQLWKQEERPLTSQMMKQRVCHAVEIQRKRFREESILFNSGMNGGLIKKYCKLSWENEELLKEAFNRMQLSARGLHRTLRVARTIADLEGRYNIEETHLIEALSYRITDMQIGG
jgi:magnesium chelatase family protein